MNGGIRESSKRQFGDRRSFGVHSASGLFAKQKGLAPLGEQ